MPRPDFARTDLGSLTERDLRFIIERFPVPGRSYEEIARIVNALPTTLDSVLDSEFLYEQVCDRSRLLLEVSPFLLFSVLLRRDVLHRRSQPERRTLNYVANLMSLFVRADRLFRVESHDRETAGYLVDLVAESEAAGARRQFLIHAHIGNYALFVTGLFPGWIEHRHRFKRRPVDRAYYTDMGRAYFQRAATHAMARELGLDDVFLRLAMLFDVYAGTLNRIARNHLAPT